MKRFITALLVFSLALPCLVYAAETYPNKPIKVIVPFAAGGGTDIIVRTLAPYLEKSLGQKLGIVNMEGASGSIGAMQVQQAPADGYTLLFTHTTLLTSYHVGVGKFTWDELTPICNVADFDLILTVAADAPWKTTQELLDDARKNPGKIKFGVNMGAGAHFAAIALELAADVKFHMVASGGDAKRTTALLGKHVDVSHPASGAIMQYVNTGKLRPLASFGLKRTPGFDNVPTLTELGLDASMPYFNGFYGPPGLPQDIVQKLDKAVSEAVQNKDFLEVLGKAAMYPDYMDQEAFRKALIKLDMDIYREARVGGLIPSRMGK